jgi:TatD DNase family protein
MSAKDVRYLDAHVHIDSYSDEQLDEVLAELERFAMRSIAVAVDPPSYERSRQIAQRSPWVVPTFGIHPWRATTYVDQLDQFDELIEASPMLGELGLDTVWVEDPVGSYPAQERVLRYFLEAARRQHKLVNLHTKGAEAQIVALLKEYSGPLDIADELIKLGCLFTIGVELDSSPLIQELAQRIPLTQLLSETDNPSGVEWLSGELGFPRHMLPVVSRLAALRGLEEEDLRLQLLQNAQSFGLL